MATKENQSIAGYEAHIGRLTRSRTAALRASLPPVPPVQANKPNLRVSKGKSKKLGSSENVQSGVSSNLGVSIGKLKKLSSDENAQIGVSSNLGVSIGKSKKLGSDENAQIGVQKRRALSEITNNAGVSLKLKWPDLDGGINKGKGKRPALDECTNNESGTKLGFPNKKRSVLRDVTDVHCGDLFKPSFLVPKAQTKVLQRGKLGTCKANQANEKGPNTILTSLSHINSQAQVSTGFNNAEEKEANGSGSKELDPLEKLERDKDSACHVIFLEESTGLMIKNDSKEGDATSSCVVNIDGEKSNTLLCTIYATDVYSNLRATELIRRPSSNFMERMQKDVTQSMRAVLVDWLVEVCDEYRLVPDTLYLTVYLIDRFLSLSYIERQRLQLLGITCMLIASKYEEICAPRVEEFCFITDNTYNKSQVLNMENQVLSLLGYQISVPTAKTFLRRFLRAAQASTKDPPTLMHLTNYLAELTLVEYGFMKFLPSEIAASAVFLARWTLDQSDHPWNDTLEHYTCYKSSDLKTSIVSMQELQLNTQNCSLKAIRDKYKQEKFESVANLASPELRDSLFC